ncbi:hypothetical protein D3C78_1851790 [compost metagenome]
MRQQVDGVDAAAPLQVLGHLLQTVAPGAQHHHLGARRQAFEQLLMVLQLAVDEHHLLARLARHGRCNGAVLERLGISS